MPKLIFFIFLILLSLSCIFFPLMVWVEHSTGQRQNLLVLLLVAGLVLMLISTYQVAYSTLHNSIPYHQKALREAQAANEILYHWKFSTEVWQGLIQRTNRSNKLAMVLLACVPLLLYIGKILLENIFKLNVSAWGINAILLLIGVVSVCLAIFLYFYNQQSNKLYLQSPKEVIIAKDKFWIGHQLYYYDANGYKVKQAVLKEEDDFHYIEVFLKAADYDNVAYLPFPKDKKEEAQAWVNSLLDN